MTPVPIELPVKAGEAVALADLVLEHAGGRSLTDGIRGRLAGRIAARGFDSMIALPASLERDPIHPDSFYMVVDADGKSVLLRLALASSPSSGLFPNSLLIGRMTTESSREVVVNAIRFDLADRGNIFTFATEINRDFQSRSGTGLPIVTAGVAEAESVWSATVWDAVRKGLRSGWTGVLTVATEEEAVQAEPLVARFTRFAVPVRATDASMAEAVRIHGVLLSAIGRRVIDFELIADGPSEIAFCRQWVAAKGLIGKLGGGRIHYTSK